MIPAEARYLIAELGLMPHPEGGHYRETYRAASGFPTYSSGDAFPAGRAWSTAIYYLLCGDDVSHLHRIRSDEIWHHYAGSSLTVSIIEPDGSASRPVLGRDIAAGETYQLTVKAGRWFGASLNETASYGLFGCTVSPGFDFRDFEVAGRKHLVAAYPEHADIIDKLTR